MGTNGGSSYTRPSTVPSRSDTVLVSETAYNASGWVETTTDPKGIVGKQYYDHAGRVTKSIENYVDGAVGDDNDRTVEYVYGPAEMTKLQAKLTGGGQQETEWVYGITTPKFQYADIEMQGGANPSRSASKSCSINRVFPATTLPG